MNYYYLYLEPGIYARFSKIIEESQLEVYYPTTGSWIVEDNPRMIKRFNQDSSQISYEDFLKYINSKNT